MKAFLPILAILVACGPSSRPKGGDDDNNTDANEPCPHVCSADLHSIVDCNNTLVTACDPTEACDTGTVVCEDACTAANANHLSVGCDYYATDMDTLTTGYCFAAFVANTWTSPAHIGVEYNGMTLTPATFTRLPVGSGPGLTYSAYDPNAGLAPGDVAVLFLSGAMGAAPQCPTTAAEETAYISGTGLGNSFHITTDVPTVAYQINPYGGGSAAVTAASLLLPTSAWDVNYVAVNVEALSIAGSPSMNIVSMQDGTIATITPNMAVVGGAGVPAGAAGTPLNITLNKGQYAQITQDAELTGSIITSNNPIGFMAGQTCMNMPLNTMYCDHGEQMIPPVRAMGDNYVGVMYEPRVPTETSTFWRIVGAVDGTQLTWSSDVGGPATIDKGVAMQFQTGTPFIVSSQDANHPFMVFTYMTSSEFVEEGYGDPDFVVDVPPAQYLYEYVFFTDPTYPVTDLVIIRNKGTDGQFHDVTLDCAGALTGWQPIGNDDFEYTRTDLMNGNFVPVGNCSTGRHDIKSDATFGLWVWGWGTPLTTDFTANVSYGYPGGMSVSPINTVVIE